MAISFALFRLSLIARPQLDLPLDNLNENISREDFIRKAFGRECKVQHYGNELTYVANPKIIKHGKDVVGGRIGRVILVEENSPPSDGFIDQFHESWKAISILVDPTEHSDGQKVAVEVDREVGSPSAVLGALIRQINLQSGGFYRVEYHPVLDASSFWQFASENAGSITNLTFEFAAPNMFGGKDSIQRELRHFREEEKAQRVTIILASNDGLKTDTHRVKESVEYAEKGAGDIKAKTKTGLTYRSKRKGRMTKIIVGSETGLRRLQKLIDLSRDIFGRG